MIITPLSSGIQFGLIALVGWGLSDYSAALTSKKEGSYRSFFWVMIFSLLSLLAYVGITRPVLSFSWSVFWLAATAGILHTIGGFCFYKGLEVGKVSLVSPIASAWSMVTVLGGVVLLNQAFSGPLVLPFFLVVLGTMLVATDLNQLLKSWRSVFSDRGIPYALAAMFGWGIGFLFLNQAITSSGWLVPNIILFSAIPLITGSYLHFKKVNLWPTSATSFWQTALMAGGLGAAAYISYSVGITTYSPVIIAPLGAAFPAVTIALATIFLKEKLNGGQIVGIGCILGGVVLMSR